MLLNMQVMQLHNVNRNRQDTYSLTCRLYEQQHQLSITSQNTIPVSVFGGWSHISCW